MPGTTGCCWPRGICTGDCLGACCGESGRCQCHQVSAPIAVTKYGAEGRGSEQCLRTRFRGSKLGSSHEQKRAVGTPLISLGAALVAVRCVQDRKSVGCASLRFKSEIPAEVLHDYPPLSCK